MNLQILGRGRPIVVALVVVAAIAMFAIAASLLGVRTAQAEYAGPTFTTAPVVTKVEVPQAGLATVPVGGVDLWSGPDRDPYFRLHEGVVLPFLHRNGDWLLVTTMCNETAWVDAADVEVQLQNQPQDLGSSFDISEAMIVLDPGHGDRDWGGVGPSGLSEKEVNLDIAVRVRDLMGTAHDVDWNSGAISLGSEVAAFGSVVLTRDIVGPNDGDFEAGLGYRATMGIAAGADAFVSIHNNTVPRNDSDIPGSEVYYSTGAEGSDRLAGLIYEELLRSFAEFDADWRGGDLLGARARLDPETDDDYYGLLRRATMPAVIVEGVYISEPDEEALLATEDFREAYAEAVYRGVVRFLSTAESGADVNSPEYFH
ncbi:MAG: N-acetylmuramoyl-L-alanine amidase, partial [Acidimicrobiia bacterium]|nr:N-acetylmuramoyl-L-alanine amidase [Acidimicrobiia bacterium]MDX2467039.1 N-acetylmuramoyl-L-alanine amidase [Acidimicrobiia bacterium]